MKFINQKYWIPLLLLVMIMTGGCKKNYDKPSESLTATKKRVRMVQLQESDEPLSITASGVLASETEVTFSFKIGGIIDRLRFEKGATIRKGQELARLDLVEINAQVVQAQNGFDKSVRDLQRVENLYRDTVATLEQVQDSRTAFEVAKATLEIAKFNQRYAKIISPIEGKVLKKMVEEGELVNPGQPVYEIGSTGQNGTQIIKVGVADKHVVKVKLGDKATLTFDAFPGKKFAARVSEIAEEANPFTGTFSIELTLDSFHKRLKNGFVGYVEIFPSVNDAHFKLPMTALIEGDGKGATVFTSKDRQTVQKREVQVQEIRSDFFTVNGQELSAGEWLVLEGGAYLSDRDSVVVIGL
ncbi:MAG: efflux RND transporter periplasmic adaptor subunit [Bacteroidota bacterium]